MADFRKINLKMGEWRFKELNSSYGAAMSLTPLPPPLRPPRKVLLWGIFFAFPAMNSPLPAEVKFMLGKTLVLGNG